MLSPLHCVEILLNCFLSFSVFFVIIRKTVLPIENYTQILKVEIELRKAERHAMIEVFEREVGVEPLYH